MRSRHAVSRTDSRSTLTINGVRQMRISRQVLCILGATMVVVSLTACSGGPDSALPHEPMIGMSVLGAKLERPSHELRVFVDSSGEIRDSRPRVFGVRRRPSSRGALTGSEADAPRMIGSIAT